MKVFVPTHHHLHSPSKDFSDGLPAFDHMERPERVEKIIRGLKGAGITDLANVEATACDAVFSLHDHDYVEFLFELSKQIEPGQEYLPSVFHEHLAEAPVWFRGGAYCREIGTPIGRHTVETALNSAACALEAAEYIKPAHPGQTRPFARCHHGTRPLH
jgi:acetoin utilization deacetylase AcuC-like enzyme